MELDLDENFNIIIGRNDVGKSTILEALEIFFNESSSLIKMEIEDLNINALEPSICIGVEFEVDSTKEYLLDTSTTTNLAEEFLLNKNNHLEIYKEWDCSSGKLTAKSLKTYLKANYIAHFSSKPLIQFRITDLKKELDKYKDSLSDYEKVNKTKSSEIRKAIYTAIEDKTLTEVDIVLNLEDGKKLYESIKSEFPLYCLFQSDRANKDSDKEVQDPLKMITKQAITEVEEQLEDIKKKIETAALQIGKETIEKLREMAPDIASILKPSITNKAWDSLFSFSFTSDNNIPINKRGSGVRRLILLNYFRAEAERKNHSSKNIIYAIEEPETSQHPNYQIMLFDALEELSKNERHQVIITTHTPEIAKRGCDCNLILLDKVDNETISIKGDEKLIKITETLGLLPYYGKLVLCVEGEYDIAFLKGINSIPEIKSIFSLEENNIPIIPMIGGNLKNWISRNYLKDTNVIEYHLYDRDGNNQYKTSVDQVNANPSKSSARLTELREMENYIHYSLIESHFNISCDTIKENWDKEDIPIFVQSKCPKLKESDVKKIINGALAKKMTKNLLEEMGTFEEIKGWFEEIKAIYQSI